MKIEESEFVDRSRTQRETRERAQANKSCLSVCACHLLGLLIAGISHEHLPTPLSYDVPKHVFSEERAWVILEKMSSPMTWASVKAAEQALGDYSAMEVESRSGGPVRTLGSFDNEIRTPSILLNALWKLNRTYNSHLKASKATRRVRMEVDIQKASGSFVLSEFLGGFVNVYRNVTNILVRLTDPSNADTDKHSVLVSAHYDAAIGTAAISDDALSIAVCIELIRNLLFSAEPLNVGVVFNLNGAEETVLQAAHGFISKHKWAAHIHTFVNLEAAGSAGKSMLFQAAAGGHSWLIAESYAKVAPWPFGSSFAQELFDSKLIPSTTDYLVYSHFAPGQRMTAHDFVKERKAHAFGRRSVRRRRYTHTDASDDDWEGGSLRAPALPGLDFAYTSNGYVYHTRKDDLQHLTKGSLQHSGDNVLAHLLQLSRLAADSDSLFGRLIQAAAASGSGNQKTDSELWQVVANSDLGVWKRLLLNHKLVFYEVFGFVLVRYPYPVAWLFHVVLAAIGLFVIRDVLSSASMRRELWNKLLRILLCNAVAVGSGVLLAVACFFVLPMAFYSQPFLWSVMCSAVAWQSTLGMHASTRLFDDSHLSAKSLHRVVMAAELCYWIVSLFAMSLLAMGTSFYPFWWCLLLTAANAFERLPLALDSGGNVSAFVTLAMSALPLSVHYAIWYNLFGFLIPILGRSGTVVPAEMVMAIMASALTAIGVAGGCVSVWYRLLAANRKMAAVILKSLRIVAVALFLYLTLFVAGSGGVLRGFVPAQTFPYSKDKPQRMLTNHFIRHGAVDLRKGTEEANESYHLWIMGLDESALEPLRSVAPEVFGAEPYQNVHHSFPWVYPMDEFISKSLVIAMEKPPFIPEKYKASVKATQISLADSSGERIRSVFEMKGPWQWSLRLDTRLINDWSLRVPVFHGSDEFAFVFWSAGMSAHISDDFFKWKATDGSEDFDIRIISRSEAFRRGLTPVRFHDTFWMEHNASVSMSVWFSAQHSNGNYACDLETYDPFLRDTLLPNTPESADNLIWPAEVFRFDL